MNSFEELLTKIMDKFLRLFMRELQKKTILKKITYNFGGVSEPFNGFQERFLNGF